MWDMLRCDMAQKAMWQRQADPRAEMAQMCGKTTRVHADAWVVPRAMSVRLMSDGPSLEYWGGNAKALFRLTFYTCHFPLFSPCGTMFPLILNVQDTWQHYRRWMRSH